jgi:hypothetical protein
MVCKPGLLPGLGPPIIHSFRGPDSGRDQPAGTDSLLGRTFSLRPGSADNPGIMD